MRLMNTKRDLSSGGGNFFRLGEGQTARVRFLYATVEDILEDGLVVHALKPEVTGQKYTQELLCGAKSDETALQDCKWCAQGINPVGRYPLALYNEETKQIEYWSKTKQWVENTLLTVINNSIAQGEPISGRVFRIIRAGSGTDTTYTMLPEAQNDGRTPDSFGEIKAPEDRNCYRPTDYEFPVVSNNGVNFNAGNNYKNNNYNNNNYNNNNYNNNNYGNNYNNAGNNFGGNNNYQQGGRRTVDDVF